MKLIVGLGNPGTQYENTRHNVGFELISNLKSQIQDLDSKSFNFDKKFQADIVKSGSLILAMPQTFMNDSGRAVRSIAGYYDIDTEDVCVAHDDLDIEMGKYKIEFARGPKIHNGIISVEQQLKTTDFWRVRIGVDNRTKEQRSQFSGRDYVLMKMSRSEKSMLDELNLEICRELQASFLR